MTKKTIMVYGYDSKNIEVLNKFFLNLFRQIKIIDANFREYFEKKNKHKLKILKIKQRKIFYGF